VARTHVVHGDEAADDGEGAGQVEAGRERAEQTAVLGRKEFAHDEEGHVGVARRVGDDEDEEAGQRQPAQRRHRLFTVQLLLAGVAQAAQLANFSLPAWRSNLSNRNRI